jgi:hypothetical protein
MEGDMNGNGLSEFGEREVIRRQLLANMLFSGDTRQVKSSHRPWASIWQQWFKKTV